MSAAAPIPPGPGVTAPFPAPPAEGGGARLGWGLAVAGLVFVLCCGGGGTALIGFFVSQVAASGEQARTVVTKYLDALRDEKYEAAYELLCDEQQEALTPERFESRERVRKKLRDYSIGEMDLATGAVPVDERYRDGSSDQVTYLLVVDEGTAELEICGRE